MVKVRGTLGIEFRGAGHFDVRCDFEGGIPEDVIVKTIPIEVVNASGPVWIYRQEAKIDGMKGGRTYGCGDDGRQIKIAQANVAEFRNAGCGP